MNCYYHSGQLVPEAAQFTRVTPYPARHCETVEPFLRTWSATDQPSCEEHPRLLTCVQGAEAGVCGRTGMLLHVVPVVSEFAL